MSEAQAVEAPTDAGEATDASGATEATEAAPAQEAAPRKLPQPVKLKFKGKEETVDDLDQLARWAQMGRGATEVFEQAKRMREEAEVKASRLDRLRGGSLDDRLALLTEALGDEEAALQFMEEALYEKRIVPQQLTPEQRQLQEMQRKLQSYEQEKAQTVKAQQEAELDRQADAIAQQYAKTAADVMAKLGWGAELAPLVLREMLPYAEQALEAGMEPVSEDILGMFMEDQRAKLGNMVGKLDGEQLLRFLGDDLANKVRKADLARLRTGQAKSAAPKQEARQQEKLPDDPMEAEREQQRRRRSFWASTPYGGR
jgi:hypothetical protein